VRFAAVNAVKPEIDVIEVLSSRDKDPSAFTCSATTPLSLPVMMV
jgi:hypothetical protein